MFPPPACTALATQPAACISPPAAGSRTKTASLKVGDVARLTLNADEPLTTTIVLRVPSNAKVFLAGEATTLTGEVREFTTNKLTDGQQWAKYSIRVEVQRDGRTMVEEKIVTLKAGERRELSIDPEVAAVARTENPNTGG